MALSAAEQAQLEALLNKQSDEAAEPKYTSLVSVVRELVRIIPGFTVNPDERQEILDYLDTLEAPANGSETG